MKQVVIAIALLVVGCAGAPKQATIGGNDLYARANELREQGRVMLPSSRAPVEVRLEDYLIDRSRDQIFHVREIVEGCHGNSLAEDTDCTVALMRDQRFVVSDHIPAQKRLPGTDEGNDISGVNKARLVLLAAGTAMAVGAAKCEVFEGCGSLLAIGAGADALLLLLTYTGMH